VPNSSKTFVSEAASNVVSHAYRQYAHQGDFELELSRQGDELDLVVRDQGCAQSRAPKRRSRHGIPLVNSLSKSFQIDGSDGLGTEVRMTFPVR
jgi:anti-sigma regulatory factor (Ser/Thr protein kinase)